MVRENQMRVNFKVKLSFFLKIKTITRKEMRRRILPSMVEKKIAIG